MDKDDLLSYLRHTKGILKSLSSVKEVHVVRGNEACDLDSAVSAIVYAFYLHKTQSESSAIAVPLLNIIQADYVLRTEVTFALQDCGITEDLLFFRDQISLTDLHDNQQLVLTLVDHHAMLPEERSLENAVCQVIDHRARVKEFPPSVDVTLELVGSCCSLVAEKLLNDARFDFDPTVARLLLGPILLDTACLQEAKTKDLKQLERLETFVPDFSMQEVYNDLLGARRNISGLSAIDVLRKDLKVISSDKLKITISSVPCRIEVFLARDDAGSALDDFTRLHHADVVIVMAIDIDVSTGGQVHRQILVHSVNASYRDQVINTLKATGPLLAIGRPISTRLEHVCAFEQDNGKSSRKKLLPVMAQFLRDLQPAEKAMKTSSMETTPPTTTSSGLGQDSAALKDTSSVAGDDSTMPEDVGSGPTAEELGWEAGDVCSPDVLHVDMHPVLMSCNGDTAQDVVSAVLCDNVVARMIASDMGRLKTKVHQTVTAADRALNVVAGRIAVEMKQTESTPSEVMARPAAGDNVVAQRIASEMLQELKTQRKENSHQEGGGTLTPLKGVDHVDSAPSEVAPPGVLVSRTADRTGTKKTVRHSDMDVVKAEVCDDHESSVDRVHAAADQLVTEVVNAAVDLYLGSTSQEYVHLGRSPGAGETEAEHGMNESEDEPSLTAGGVVTPAPPLDGHKVKRPTDLESTPKKKIVPLAGELLQHEDIEVSVGSSSSSEVGLSIEDEKTPDDLTTPDIANDSVFGSLDWESDTACSPVEPIPEYTAQEEFDDERSWKTVQFGNKCYRIDMKVIEPYKKVLSHGGYYGDGFNAIVVLTACHLPDKRRRDYNYVMDNLFLYVLNTLDLLVVDDYVIVYFHGAAPSHKIPTVRWLKRCYDLIDRRLRKNLKQLVIVHPTLWLKTVALMSRPFISSKFLSKLKYVKNLDQLKDIVPMEYIHIPDEVKQYDESKSPSPASPT